jgi:hypothetical protein
MLGYSPHIHARDLYEIFFEPASWVGNVFCRLDSLDLFSVPVSWDAPGLLNLLKIVEISDFSPALFPVAINLRVVRLRPMWAFKFPTGYCLRSALLQMLDVKFYSTGRALSVICWRL